MNHHHHSIESEAKDGSEVYPSGRASPTFDSQSSPEKSNPLMSGKPVTPHRKKEPTNAFALIMSGSGKKRKHNRITGSTSKFLPCPVCGFHVLPHEMNKHLDKCLARQGKQTQEPNSRDLETNLLSHPRIESIQNDVSCDTATPVCTDETIRLTASDTPPVCTPAEDNIVQNAMSSQSNDVAKVQMLSPTKRDAPVNQSDETQETNVFSQMMKNSVKAFSENETTSIHPKLYQQLHLDHNGNVSVRCYRSKESLPSQEDVAWSTTIQIRGKQDVPTSPIELVVTSSVPSSASTFGYPSTGEPIRQRLVRHHSRLSVPVLKSILQKSIRRRKPLPSVRVACELADKSLGDLLRRLPIIILEDSTLHPSFPFLVWIMVAVSKDFNPPLTMLKRVLEIVFEISSCRWQDSLRLHTQESTRGENSPSADSLSDAKPDPLTLASLHQTKLKTTSVDESWEALLHENEMIVWSILMRRQYGGMSCDIRMLQGYAELWHKRFCSIRELSMEIRNRLSPIPTPRSDAVASGRGNRIATASEKPTSKESLLLEEWTQVPSFIHQPCSRQSSSRIDRLLMAKTTVAQSPDGSQNPSQTRDHGHYYYYVGLTCLCSADLTPEGIDFHCSSILESAILSNPSLVQDCFIELESIGLCHTQSGESRHSWLEGILKSCMWRFSAGVNLRQPLFVLPPEEPSVNERQMNRLKKVYETLIKPETKLFSERYIFQRLSKRFQC